MSRKTIARIAIIMIIVFGSITLLYPRLFHPDADNGTTPVEAPPMAPPAAGP